jgi:hypothetical protein
VRQSPPPIASKSATVTDRCIISTGFIDRFTVFVTIR